jgi:hypothetical protein
MSSFQQTTLWWLNTVGNSFIGLATMSSQSTLTKLSSWSTYTTKFFTFQPHWPSDLYHHHLMQSPSIHQQDFSLAQPIDWCFYCSHILVTEQTRSSRTSQFSHPHMTFFLNRGAMPHSHALHGNTVGAEIEPGWHRSHWIMSAKRSSARSPSTYDMRWPNPTKKTLMV